jgi:nephrocystin-3
MGSSCSSPTTSGIDISAGMTPAALGAGPRRPTMPRGRRKSIFEAVSAGNNCNLQIPPDMLDENGYLFGTDFDIDSNLCDADNEQHWAQYLERRKKFDAQLKVLYGKMNRRQPLKLPENINYIRPFLSSTFKDFNEERNICFAGSFPRLEKLCNDRGVFFAPLDLRWGVTSEQSGSGQVIKICLEEIDRSRPYFVCSLGFRNGWTLNSTDNPEGSTETLCTRCPPLISSMFCLCTNNCDCVTNSFVFCSRIAADQYVKLLKKTFEIGMQAFPWIGTRMDRSVTELEILHGALNNPNLSPRTYFYLRDVAFLHSLPKDRRKLFCELGEAEKKLQALKLRIVLAGFKIKYFTTPIEMSDALEEDFKESIEADFPAQKLSALDREIKDHQAFVEMRTRVYVGGENYLQQLDNYMNNPTNNKPFVITGPSGAGKSSLLSNWMKRVKEKIKNNQFGGKTHAVIKDGKEIEQNGANQDLGNLESKDSNSNNGSNPRGNILHWNLGLVQDRYIGSTSDSAQPATLIRWLLQEIKSKFEYIEQAIPPDNKKLIEEWPDWLELAASQAPLLLVIDGLDQLVEADDAHLLHWLPTDFPKGVRVVVSTVTDSETHRVLMERGCDQGIAIHPLQDPTCLQLIRDYLGSYGKQLDSEQEQRIMNCERTRNPLYLITFLQEVRVFGSFENLSKRIDHYLEAKSISEMFSKVIQRLEEDFDSTVPGLVKFTLCLMLVARRGLNEVELKGALELALHVSALQKSFPNMEFSALMLRLDQQLVDQRGLRQFSHNYLRSAVENKYFASRLDAIQSHHILADYFNSTPVSDRKVEEMPWHIYTIIQYALSAQYKADLKQLAATNSNTNNSSDESHSSIDLSSLQKRLQDSLCDLDMFEILQSEFKYDLHKYWLLLEQSKHQPNLACASYTASLSQFNKKIKPKPIPFAEKAEDVGTFLISTDRYTGADVFFDQALSLREKEQGPDHPDVELLLSKKANLFYRMGRYDEALPLYRQALKIVEKHEGINSVRSSVLRTSIAGLLKEQGKFEESQPLYEQSLQDKISLLGPRHPVVATSMANLADLFLRMFKPEKALPLYEEALHIMEVERGRNHPEVATILSSLASCYMQVKKHEESIKLYERARKIKEDVYGANHISVAVVLNNLAATYHSQGDHAKALKLYERSLKIRQQAHGKESSLIAPTLNNMGLIYLAEQKYRTALSYFTQALSIMEAAYGKFHIELVTTLNSISKIHMEEKKYDTALLVYMRELEILEKTYGPADEKIQQALNNVGMVHQSMNNFDKALPFHVRELQIIQNKYGELNAKVAEILMIIGVVFASMENHDDDAKNTFKRCYLIRRQLFGEESELTVEAKGWFTDLSADEEEFDWNRMKLSEIPPLKYQYNVEQTQKKAERVSLPPLVMKNNLGGASLAAESKESKPQHRVTISKSGFNLNAGFSGSTAMQGGLKLTQSSSSTEGSNAGNGSSSPIKDNLDLKPSALSSTPGLASIKINIKKKK